MIFPNDGLHKAENGGFIAVDGRVGRIFRHQTDAFFGETQALDRGFVTEERDHDLSVHGGGLGSNDHRIAVQNAGADHGIAANPQGIAAFIAIPRQVAFDIFLRQNGETGGGIIKIAN